MNQKPKKLLDQVRDRIRVKQYSHRTEQTYVHWIRKYILYHNKRHPKDMGISEIEEFFSYLAENQKVSSSTQNQALSAILFLYREFLEIQFPDKVNAIRGKRSNHIPTVLSKDEVTCPPRPDPEVVIGFRKNGGRKWQDKEDLHRNKSS